MPHGSPVDYSRFHDLKTLRKDPCTTRVLDTSARLGRFDVACFGEGLWWICFIKCSLTVKGTKGKTKRFCCMFIKHALVSVLRTIDPSIGLASLDRAVESCLVTWDIVQRHCYTHC